LMKEAIIHYFEGLNFFKWHLIFWS
jgi:hypothetical protein